MSHRLPSLNALRAFAEAARLGSLTAAAEALHVTHGAISRQVRALELDLGVALFERAHRRVILTEAGRRLAVSLEEGFAVVAKGVEAVRRPAEAGAQALRLTMEPAIASRWLLPRLPRFLEGWPGLGLKLDSTMAVLDIPGGEADIAIRYSVDNAAWPGTEARFLTDIRVSPVLAPALAARLPAHPTPADLLALPLLHDDDGSLWRRWCRLAAIPAPGFGAVVSMPDYALQLDAILRGDGVGLGDDLLVDTLVADGRLVRPFPALSLHHGRFWLVTPKDRPLSAAGQAFAAWVLAEMDR